MMPVPLVGRRLALSSLRYPPYVVSLINQNAHKRTEMPLHGHEIKFSMNPPCLESLVAPERKEVTIMRTIILSIILSLTPVATLAAGLFSNLIISEAQIAGETAKDEFVELFNPTTEPVKLAGWSLKKRTASGRDYNLVRTFPDITVQAYSFLLIAHPTGYAGEVEPDLWYSRDISVAKYNTVLLSDAEGTIVDKVGIADFPSVENIPNPTDANLQKAEALWQATEAEGQPAPVPPKGQSISRKSVRIRGSITAPAQDTDNNAEDFIIGEPGPTNSEMRVPSSIETGKLSTTWAARKGH